MLSSPWLSMEDFRWKVRQRFRSMNATFREAFQHLSGEKLNNEMYLKADEFADILEALEINEYDTRRLFAMIDANNTGQLTLFEFFKGVRIFTPSTLLMDLWVLIVQSYKHISDAFRGCHKQAPLDRKAFAELLEHKGFMPEGDHYDDHQTDQQRRLEIFQRDLGRCRTATDAMFDFLDTRNDGTVTVTELITALQCLQPGPRERLPAAERNRKVERSVKAELAPLHHVVTEFKQHVRQFFDERDAAPRTDDESAEHLSKSKSHGTFDPMRLTIQNEEEVGKHATARNAFHRINKQFKALPPEKVTTSTVEGLRSYFKSSRHVLVEQRPCLQKPYTRTKVHSTMSGHRNYLESGAAQVGQQPPSHASSSAATG
eukprot:gnl/TRDRNA2_/TRDRNA2_158661_c0_seq1.p1 gnl/TRDRNA2_/TRDRNA2_158661_c0~~gnl/TRDRNA2_/TRDRNA2_158661_c0_seq1.p1  ORF type:complete len:373 (-),score=69.40 gnl/TRDRNA2_/TRDRNA2_158661_c0_seq1:52-1170(-)